MRDPSMLISVTNQNFLYTLEYNAGTCLEALDPHGILHLDPPGNFNI